MQNTSDTRKTDKALSNKCELCGALDNLQLCSACREVWYCSKEHQRNHWRHHKSYCQLQRSTKKKFYDNKELSTVNNNVTADCITVNQNHTAEGSENPSISKHGEKLTLSKSDKDLQQIIQKVSECECSPKSNSGATTSDQEGTGHISEPSDERGLRHKTEDDMPVNKLHPTSSSTANNDSLNAYSSPSHPHTSDPTKSDKEHGPKGSSLNQDSDKTMSRDSSAESLSDIYQQPYSVSQASPPHIGEEEDDLTDSNSPNQPSKSPDKSKSLVQYILQCLEDYGICVIDHFLGNDMGDEVLKEVKALHSTGHLIDGQVVAPSKDSKRVRLDQIVWIEQGERNCDAIGKLIQRLDTVVMQCNTSFTQCTINGRTKAMVACYPGHGTHYIQHVDNPNGDGRRITCIYYLNKDWNKNGDDGGLLRIYPQKCMKHVAQIEPEFDRLLFFWSDYRNPHEVCPTHRTRYAITVWYFDAVERARAKAKEEIKRRCREQGIDV